MGLIDSQLRLGTAQAFSASGATTDYWDSGSARNVGNGEPLVMLFSVSTAADFGTTDETYTFAIQGDDNSGFSSPMTLCSLLFSLANTNSPGVYLTAGKQVAVDVPVGTIERYIRGYLTLGGTTPSISVSTDIVPRSMVPKSAFYASGFTVQ